MDVDGVGKFLITILLLPTLALSIIILVRRMIDGELSGGVGACGIIAMLGLHSVAVATQSYLVAGGVVLVAVTLVVFFPFAENTLCRAELAQIDHNRLENAFKTIHAQPTNVPIRFQLAEMLYENGLKREAAYLAEQTLEGLSTVIDPMRNSSMRDLYRTEETRAKRWRREADASPKKPIKCPSCGFLNSKGSLTCEQCQKPYLLELARERQGSGDMISKLVMSWVVIAVLLGGAMFLSDKVPGSLFAPVLIGAVTISFLIIWNLFRVKKIG